MKPTTTLTMLLLAAQTQSAIVTFDLQGTIHTTRTNLFSAGDSLNWTITYDADAGVIDHQNDSGQRIFDAVTSADATLGEHSFTTLAVNDISGNESSINVSAFNPNELRDG